MHGVYHRHIIYQRHRVYQRQHLYIPKAIFFLHDFKEVLRLSGCTYIYVLSVYTGTSRVFTVAPTGKATADCKHEITSVRLNSIERK